MNTHPFLNANFHINWATLKPEYVEPDLTEALKRATSAVSTVANQSRPLSYENTFGALDLGLEELNHAWGKVSHLDSVNNSTELRNAYNAMLPKVTEFFAGIPLNHGLWKTLKAFGESPAASKLSLTQKRHIDESLADFREQGADLPDADKKRAHVIQSRLAEITQKYSENVLDATNAWEKIITNKDTLTGLPDSAIDAARENASQKGYGTEDSPAWRFTLQAPSLIPILSYADNEELRREVWQAFNKLGRAEPYDNRELVKEILELRHEFAKLVEKQNFADLVTERRMVGSGQAALDFSDEIHKKIKAAFAREVQILQTFKADSLGHTVEPLEPWESGYWAEKQRKAQYDFDEEALRPYFPINRVISGLFKLAEQIFALRIVEREATIESTSEKPQVWHEEVKFYDLFDHTEQHLGSFYADWHPREPKRGGAWMNYFITGSRRSDAPKTPHLGLICGNMTPSVGGKPALLTHNEVKTVFHEFGHLLHHLCGNVEVKSLNGVNVAWDFVELPSQIMENWCWERESLDLFARHYETGETIPTELFEKMIAARNYMKASANMRQLSFGKMDLDLHIDWPLSNGQDLDTFVEEKLSNYTVDYKTKPLSNIFHFSHLFSSPTGYAAGYYSYKWAEVLDADAFTRFRKEGILNAQTGAAFREKILSKGNSEDPAKLFADFMGRAPNPDALLERDGLLS